MTAPQLPQSSGSHSGREAVSNLAECHLSQGKRLRRKHHSAQCRLLLDRAGSMTEVHGMEDRRYRLAVDELG